MYIVCIVYSVGAISNQKLNKIKDENFWAQVRRQNKKPPPEGWELIEPTLEELEGKMRWAYITIFNSSQEMCVQSNCYVSQQEWLLLGKPRQTTMRGREKWRRCGRSLRSTTRSQGDLTEYLDVNLWICDRMFARQWTSEDSFDQQPCLQVSLWSLLSAQGNLQGALWLLRQGWASIQILTKISK